MGERCAKGEKEGKEAVLKVLHLCLGGRDEGLTGVGERPKREGGLHQ